MAQDVMQEYVVKLGTVIDNEGVNRILSFLDSSKVKALGLAGALAGVTTAVYKFIESATAHEFELQKLAKQQKKSIELVRAENNAMKAMGKTMAEINKDKDLKAVYKDIVEFNKEMQMPNMDAALDKVRGLEVAFTKLKAVINTATQWINAQVLINLERPLDRITGKTQGFSEWLKENMKNYAPKIATVLTDFAKGIMGIVEAGGKVLKWLNELPQAIKNVLVIVGSLIALIKGGTIGRLIFLIGLIGDILHDKDVYDWNKANGGNVPTLSEIWDIWYDDDLDPTGKAKAIATKIIEILNRNIKDAFKDFKMSDIFGDGRVGGQGLFSEILGWFEDNKGILEEFGKNLVLAISGGIRAGGGIVGGAAGMLMNAIFGDDTMSEYTFSDEDGSAAATFAGALGGFVYNFSEAMKKNKGNIFKSFKKGLNGATIGGILTSAIANITEDEDGKIMIDWDNIGIDLSNLSESVLNLFEKAIKTTQNFGSLLFERIGSAISDLNLGQEDLNSFGTKIGSVFRKWSSNQTLMSGISTSITAALTGANFWESILTGVVGSFVGGKSEAREQMQKYLGENSGIPWDVILGLDDKSLEKEFKRFGGEGTFLTKTLGNLGTAGADLLTGIFEVLMESAKGVSTLSSDLWQIIVNAIGDALSVDISGTGNSIFGGMLTTFGATTAIGGNFIQALLASLTTGMAKLSEDYNGDFGRGIKEEAKKFWYQLQLLWYGGFDQDSGEIVSVKGKGLHSLFEELFIGSNGESGIQAFFEGLAGKVTVWLKPLGSAIVEFFKGIWIEAYNAIPEGIIKDAITSATGGDPNKTTVQNRDGKYYLKGTQNTSNTEFEIPAGSERLFTLVSDVLQFNNDGGIEWKGPLKNGIPGVSSGGNLLDLLLGFEGGDIDQEKYFGELFKPYVSEEKYKAFIESIGGTIINPPENKGAQGGGGGGRPDSKELAEKTDETTEKLGDLSGIAEDATDAIDEQTAAMEDLSDELDKGTEKTETFGDSIGQAESDVDDFADTVAGALESVSALGTYAMDASGAISNLAGAASSAAGALASIQAPGKAWGGRIGSAGHFLVGEDGPEYIIPITKRDRAMSLINQMFSEMGMGALNKASNDLGIGTSASFGTLGGSLDSLINGIGGNTNISAPINIYVTASGSDAKEIGAAAYDAAERHLVKTLRGVVA